MTNLATVHDRIPIVINEMGIDTYLFPLLSSIIPALIGISQDHFHLGAA